MEQGLKLNPFYLEAKNEITRPDRFVAMSQYFVDYWMPRLGPTATCMVIFLRRRGFLNNKTGECRDHLVIAQKEIAEACQCSIRTIHRELATNNALRSFVRIEEQYERNSQGHVRQLENLYHIAMDDPIVAEHQARLEILIGDRQRIADENQSSDQANRKRIRRATERQAEKSAPVLKPHLKGVVGQNGLVGEGVQDVVGQIVTPPGQNDRLLIPVSSDKMTEQNNLDTSIDTLENNNAGQLEENGTGVVVALCACGITERVAKDLSKQHSPEAINAQIQMLAYRDPDDPAAVLVQSIRENWAPPGKYTRIAREKLVVEQQRLAQQLRASEHIVQRQKQSDRDAEFQKVWDSLPAEKREAVENQARETIYRESGVLARTLERGTSSVALEGRLALLRRSILISAGAMPDSGIPNGVIPNGATPDGVTPDGAAEE